MGNAGGRSQNGLMAPVLGIVVIAGGWYLFSNSSSSTQSVTPPSPMEMLLKKTRVLENPLSGPLEKAVELATVSSITSSKMPDRATLQKIVLAQVKKAYQPPRLNADEFGKVFAPDYKWDDYTQIFGTDWLTSLYTVADQSAQEKTAKLSEKEQADATLKKAQSTIRQAQEEINKARRMEQKAQKTYHDVTGQNLKP